jgi:hypothetical protein
MDANTNATSGYAITYIATGFIGPQETMASFPSSGTSNSSTPGSLEQFGFNLTTNTAPAVGTSTSGSGSGSCAINAVYCTANSFAYNTSGDVVASSSAPTQDNIFTISYVANILPTTKPGAYSATQTFICTAMY